MFTGLAYQASIASGLMGVMYSNDGPSHSGSTRLFDQPSLPLVIATILGEEGITGVHTHVRQLRQYLENCGMNATLLTPFSWGRTLTVPVFGLRLVLERCSRSAGVVWFRHWHEVFLYNALRKCLAKNGDCVIYAQGPSEARVALRARRGPHQRVVMAVHFRISQADEWADKKQIKRDGTVFRAIRQLHTSNRHRLRSSRRSTLESPVLPPLAAQPPLSLVIQQVIHPAWPDPLARFQIAIQR